MKPKVKNWVRLMESGELKSSRAKVLHYIFHSPGTDLHSIRVHTGLAHQTATGALSDLMDEGIVKSVGERVIEENHYSILYFVEEEKERNELATDRRFANFIAWAKRGVEDFADILPREARLALMQYPIKF